MSAGILKFSCRKLFVLSFYNYLNLLSPIVLFNIIYKNMRKFPQDSA